MGCDSMPGSRVVTWTSSLSRVAGGVVEDLADFADGRWGWGERVPVDDGAGEDGGVFGRRVGGDGGGLGGGECEGNDEQSKKGEISCRGG